MKTNLICLSVLMLIITFTTAQVKNNSNGNLFRNNSDLFGNWEVFSYSVNSNGDTSFQHYTEYSNGCDRIEKCNPNSDKIGINTDYNDSTVTELYWRYEKGGQEIKFSYPDTLFFDDKVYTTDSHIWVPYKITFVSKDEFIIYNWRFKNCTNRFIRRKE